MRYYLAYGSNLSVEQMAYRCPFARRVGTSVIKDYRLLFKGSKTGSYLTIEPMEGREVPVLVWRVTAHDEAALDRYEGFPTFYRKETMTVNVNGEDLEAFVYIMDERRVCGRPSMYYYRVCDDGYKRFGFDRDILKQAYIESA